MLEHGAVGGFGATFPKNYTSASAMSPIIGLGGPTVAGGTW